jgi:hypothetical protein
MVPGPAKGSLANVTRLGPVAVAAIGVTRRTTLPRQPKLPGPGALCRVPLGTNGGQCWRGHSAMHRFVPAAVVRWPRVSEGTRNGNTTGGRAEQASKHRARDAGELADLRLRESGRRFIEKHRPA